MSKIFLNLDRKNEYYFDLLSILASKYPEDEIDKQNAVKDYSHISEISETFCRSFPISKDGCEKPTRQHNRFISGKSIIDNRFGSVVNKFLQKFSDFSEEAFDKYTDYLNALFGAIISYSIPATVIAKDSDLGVVIRVFEKVNSTGKKLTLFDLINAKSFQTTTSSYSMGFADYVTKDLITKNLDSKLLSSMKTYLRYNDNNNTFERLDRIIRTLEISYLLKNNQSPSMINSIMLSRDADFWFNEWNNSGDIFAKAVNWIVSEGLSEIGQTTYLEYVIAIFLANPKSLDIGLFRQKIKRYAYYLSLAGMPFNKSNLNIVESLYGTSKSIVKKLPYRDLSYSINLSEEDILKITPSTTKFQTILNIFYMDKLEGKFTVDLTGIEINQKQIEDMDKHHIFPKSKVNNFNSRSEFNSIANQILLCNFNNREVFRDKMPKSYLSSIEATQDRIAFSCEQNLIDYVILSQVDNEDIAKQMIRERAKRIANVLNKNIISINN